MIDLALLESSKDTQLKLPRHETFPLKVGPAIFPSMSDFLSDKLVAQPQGQKLKAFDISFLIHSGV